MTHHAAQVRRQDSPALGHRRLDAVEHLGDQVVVEAGQHDPPAAVGQAGRGAGAEGGEVRAARDAPGPVMGPAQPGLRRAVRRSQAAAVQSPEAPPGPAAGYSAAAADVGGHALAPPAPEPVAAQAQVVRPDGPFEAGDPAHLAAPVTRPVLRARSQRGEGIDAGFFARFETAPAAAARPLRSQASDSQPATRQTAIAE